LRKVLQNRAACADGFVGAENHGEGAKHKHHRAPSRGLGQHVCSAARTEGRLAACATESAGKVSRLAALQQHDNDENQTIQNKKWPENPSSPREAKTQCNDREADEQRDRPFHPTWHCKTSFPSKNIEDQNWPSRFLAALGITLTAALEQFLPSSKRST
jgi:hypothetical protein